MVSYKNWTLTGTVSGHPVEVFFRILRASNGEVAGFPVLVVDGKTYGGEMGTNIVRELKKAIGSGTTSN
jgi:hypothetical protein